jgi:hypothetical protein
MIAPITDGTDVWVVVPASPPLRPTIRAALMTTVVNVACRFIAASQKAGK